MNNSARHSGWPDDARRGHCGAGPQSGPDELTAIQHGGLLTERAVKRYGYLSSPNA